jgi:hypothetical protein
MQYFKKSHNTCIDQQNTKNFNKDKIGITDISFLLPEALYQLQSVLSLWLRDRCQALG